MIADLLADPHFWTAGAYVLIGARLIVLALCIWWAHPLKRAFIFGPLLTETGVRFVLHNWPFVFLFGAFIFSCAADHAADAIAMAGRHMNAAVNILGWIEATISWATAFAMVGAEIRGRWWTRL
jgi:hypothetical protein